MQSNRKSAALLREYVKRLHSEDGDINRLRVFDFDDTLVVTDAKVWVTDGQGVKRSMTPAEFAVYDRKHDDVMDYVEFCQLINPRPITWMGSILRRVYDKHGPDGLVILSARSVPEPIEQFLASIGIEGVKVTALNNADPNVKATWVDRWIREKKLDFIEFFDDSHKNVAAINSLKDAHPNVHIVARHVIDKWFGDHRK